MKKKAKIIIEIFAALMLLLVLTAGIFSSSAVSDDPADSYEYQEAEYEDYSIDMWFDYSFRKTYTSDNEPTGMDTFSIYMGKNEIESAQFVLYSEDTQRGMTAELTPFTDGNGHTVDAEIYYEFYITMNNLNTENVRGATAETTFIRNGECPDPVAPLSGVGAFQLNAGKSQAFLIRAKTLEDSVAGWYSAQLNIKNSDGETVKTATVYLKVWDFVVSEKTKLKTAWVMDNKTTYGGNYQIFYDYLLENRLNACDIPGGRPSSDNAYITNDRVAAIRISSTGLGSVGGGYLEHAGNYAEIYADLADTPYWEDVKDKFYFYPGDEPMSLEQQTAINNSGGDTVDTIEPRGKAILSVWPEAKIVIPFHENHPYPYNYYHSNINLLEDYQKKDAFQQMMDNDYISVICAQFYSFTPTSELNAIGYNRLGGQKARNLSCTISGMFTHTAISARDWAEIPVDWEALYGDAYDRLASNIALGPDYLETWAYSVGDNTSYTYCSHDIENTGLQNKMFFWQLYQNDVTGYLYYASNGGWDSGATDTTVTGAKNNLKWRVNPGHSGVYNTYGDSVLFYGRDMGYVRGVDVIGSLRVEILRDGAEEYQMMYQLSELAGDAEAKRYVNSVSDNVANYLSLPVYDRSEWSSDMDDYDVMEAARRNLGNALEEATALNCEHQYGNGVVTTPAGCITVGTRTYTCTLCGAQKQETVPMLHESGESYETVSETPATCTVDGTKLVRCTVCGYRRQFTTPSNHSNDKTWYYENVNATQHRAYCSVCDADMGLGYHQSSFHKTAPTCTADGEKYMGCIYCDWVSGEKEILPATGHDFVDGVCTICGEAEEPEITVTYGDLNGDGKVTATDINMLSKALVGTVTLSEVQATAADVSGDGKTTATDTNLINKYLSGTISAFPVELQ